MTPSPARAQPRSLTLIDEPTLDKECPLCEQAISRERLLEIQAKLKADQVQQAKQLEERLRSEFQATEAETRLRHEAALAQATAELAATHQADQEAARVLAREELDAAREEADAAKAAAAAASRDAEERLAKLSAEAEAREARARAAGREAAVQEAAEKLKRVTEEKESKAKELAAAVDELASVREVLKASEAQATEKLELARKTAREDALEEASKRVTAVESERDALAAEKSTLAQQVAELREGQEEALAEAVAKHSREVREALESEHQVALAKKEAEGFAERQRLQKSVDELKRRLDRKTAEELGEGAEVDLFNNLLGAFSSDRIERIKKGEAGADIRHTIMSDGHACGTILYDSKNRKQWRTSYASKLRHDQVADNADHAILTTRAFPARSSQLCIQEGVILANPARVVQVVELLRTSLIEVHRLRISAEERQAKTEAIYDFISSPRFTRYMERLEEIATKISEVDANEKKTHDRVWQKRGVLTQALAKATSDLNLHVTSILRG